MRIIQLPDAQRSGGMPLRDALSARRSVRQYSARRFRLDDGNELQLLSDLLWASWGHISPKRRSAPSSHNWQETSIYLLLPEGSFIYDAAGNRLIQTGTEDLRAASGLQDYVESAALQLVLVADKTKLAGKAGDGITATIYADTGYICQNIYLFCAAEGLGTVSRAMVPRKELALKLGLDENSEITLVQTIGWKDSEK